MRRPALRGEAGLGRTTRLLDTGGQGGISSWPLARLPPAILTSRLHGRCRGLGLVLVLDGTRWPILQSIGPFQALRLTLKLGGTFS